MGASVGGGVETSVDSEQPGRTGGRLHLEVRLLGTLSVARDGAAVALPPSRKVRALFGYLALAPQPAGRSQLCELLWDVSEFCSPGCASAGRESLPSAEIAARRQKVI
jgi:hypothetical protein